MNKPWIMVTILLMVLTALLGFVVVEWYGQALLEGSLIQWQPVGVVPEHPRQIVRIIDDGIFPVLIEGDSGKIYRCCEDFRQPTWQDVPPPAHLPTPVPDACASFTQFPKPGITLDCAALAESEFALGHIEYMVYADGSVWRWHQRVGLLTSILIEVRFFAALAAGVSALFVFQLSRRIWRSRLG